MWGCSVVVRESNDLLVLSVAPQAGIKIWRWTWLIERIGTAEAFGVNRRTALESFHRQ